MTFLPNLKFSPNLKKLLCLAIYPFLAGLCFAATPAPPLSPLPPVLEYKLPPTIPLPKLEANAKEILALSDAEVLAMAQVQTPFITSVRPLPSVSSPT